MIVRVPLPDYRPDQTIASGVLTVCENAYPAADNSYRPVRAISTFSDALAASFNGGISAISTGGTGYLLAGTSSALYKYDAGAWTSLTTGLTVNRRWQFTPFGNYVVGITGGDTYEIDLTSGNESVIAAAPSGTCVATIGDHVFIGQPDGAINEVSWSAFRDHTSWTPGTDQSGNQPFQTGGEVQGIAGGEYGIVFQRERLVRVSRTGESLAPFQFDEISVNFGCSNGATIAQAGRTIFFYSDRGFMALDDGQALRQIGSERVDRRFEDVVGRDNLSNVFAAVDPENKLVFWGVPGAPGRIWIYHYELDRWGEGSFAFTGILPGFTSSTTLEALAATHTDLDAMTISLDDSRWRGGHPQLYLFDGDNKLGTLTGANLATEFKLAFAELVQGQRARIRGVRPITDAVEGVTVSMDARLRLGDAESIVSTDDLRDTGFMPLRVRGRYIAPGLKYAAGSNWTYARGLEIECQPGGLR